MMLPVFWASWNWLTSRLAKKGLDPLRRRWETVLFPCFIPQGTFFPSLPTYSSLPTSSTAESLSITEGGLVSYTGYIGDFQTLHG